MPPKNDHRPTLVFVASYSDADTSLTDEQKKQADDIAYELGRTCIEKDIDLSIGGHFDLARPFASGAAKACEARGIQLRDRLTNYFAENWPPPQDAPTGRLFEIEDTDNFFLRILQKADGLIAYSGRDNTKNAIECAELIDKDIYPFGTVKGASKNAWRRKAEPHLQFLGDRSLSANAIAKTLTETFLQRNHQKKRGIDVVQAKNEAARTGDILILIHGIRTEAAWAEMVKSKIESKTPIKVVPIRYGFFDLVRFLSPEFLRTKPIRRITEEIQDIRGQHRDVRISAIAHSFGCYVLLKTLDDPNIVLHKIILCGSVAPDFRVARHRAQIEFDPIINDCGTEDYLPALASSAASGYGPSGSSGFGTVGIRDRFHKLPHSGFFTEEFVDKFWVPFFQSGSIVPSDIEKTRATPTYLQSIVKLIPIKWALLLFLCALIIFPVINLSGSTINTCYQFDPRTEENNGIQQQRDCRPGHLSHLKWIDETAYPAHDKLTGRWPNDRTNRSLAYVKTDEEGTPIWTEQNLVRSADEKSYWQLPQPDGWIEIVADSLEVQPETKGSLLRRQPTHLSCNSGTPIDVLEIFIPSGLNQKKLDDGNIKICFRWSRLSCSEIQKKSMPAETNPFDICAGRATSIGRDPSNATQPN